MIIKDIGIIARCYDTIANIEFKDVSLNRGQYVYLVGILENDGILQHDLISRTRTEKATATRALKKLEENKLITINQSEKNKKYNELRITDKGRSIGRKIQLEHEYSNNNLLKGLTTEEKNELTKLMKKIKSNAESEYNYVKSGNKRDY